MRSLKHYIKLHCSIKIYVPSTDRAGAKLDARAHVEKTLEFLAQSFGGATACKALGAWQSTQGGALTFEGVTIVFAYATEADLVAKIETVYTYCLALKAELNQESLALEVNNELYFL